MTEQRAIYVYGLRDPDSGIRYVGLSWNPGRRFKQHSHAPGPIRQWIESVRDEGREVQIAILETVLGSKEDGLHRERHWQAQFRHLLKARVNIPGRVLKNFTFRRETADILGTTAARLGVTQTRILEALIERHAPTLRMEVSSK